MNSNTAAILQKVAQERERGDYVKALRRLADAISKNNDIDLFTEAIEVALEASDSLKAVDYFKLAYGRFPNHGHTLWNFTTQKLGKYNDPILASYLFEFALKKRELGNAEEVLETLKDQTVGDLLKRTRNKKQTLTSTTSGGTGYRQEIMVNALAEAMLCVRTKRFQDAVQLFLMILVDKPIEHETLTPFFERLEKANKNNGSVMYGLGCCFLAADKYSKGLQKIVAGVSQAPTLAKQAATRLQGLQDHPQIPNEELDYSLARIHLIDGNDLLAAARLNALIMNGRGKAPVVVELLAPYIENIGEDLTLHLLYLDAALSGKREDLALKHARVIYKSPGHRTELLEWFDTKAQAQALPTEFQSAHGEMLLDQGMHERAVEIFRAVLLSSPQDQHMVAAALSRHSSNPHAQALINELNATIERQGGRPAGNGLEIEHYGEKDNFSFDPARQNAAQAAPPQSAPPEQAQAAAPAAAAAPPAQPAPVGMGLTGERDPFAEPAPAPVAPTPEPRAPVQENTDTGIIRQESPFGNSTPPVAPERRPSWHEQARPKARPEMRPRSIELSGPAIPSDPPPAAEEAVAPVQPAPEPRWSRSESQSPVTAPAVAQTPPQGPLEATTAIAPNTTPFEIATAAPTGTGTEARPTSINLPYDGPPATPPVTPARERATSSFHVQFEKFERKELSNTEILGLIERAHRHGHWDEMKALLSFHPANIGEDIKRKFHLAGYYADNGQALNGLVALRTVNVSGLGRDERRAFLMRIATCYRELNRFDAAHSVYLRMMSEEENFPALEEIAKSNYRQYVEQLASDALVLEKVTLV